MAQHNTFMALSYFSTMKECSVRSDPLDAITVQQRSTRIELTAYDYRQQSYRASSSGFSLFSVRYRKEAQ
jgi:hypothetical protein